MLTKSQVERFKTEGPNPREIVALIDTCLNVMTANEREWAWQRTATGLLKVFEHAVSELIDNPPPVVRVGAPAARFVDWIDGARKVCADTREFLRTGVAAKVDEVTVLEVAKERNALLTAVQTANFRVAPDAFDTPTLWCKECKRDSGFHHDHCSKADNVRSMDARHANDQALIRLYKMALMRIVAECAGSGALAVELAREALSPKTFKADDPRMQIDLLAELERKHMEQMDHLLEKSSVPAVHYLAGAVKHLLAGYGALGMMNDEHHGRLGRIERIVEGIEQEIRGRDTDAVVPHVISNLQARIRDLEMQGAVADVAQEIQRVVRKEIPFEHDRPRIVCLCGSTRFSEAFARANLEETLKGNIVLTVGSMTHSDADIEACVRCHTTVQNVPCMPGYAMHQFEKLASTWHTETKKALDELHKKKIEMADEIFVLNAMKCTRCDALDEIHGDCRHEGMLKSHDLKPYIGKSTRSEIEHALKHGKLIRFLNPQGPRGFAKLYGDDIPLGVDNAMAQLGLAP